MNANLIAGREKYLEKIKTGEPVLQPIFSAIAFWVL